MLVATASCGDSVFTVHSCVLARSHGALANLLRTAIKLHLVYTAQTSIASPPTRTSTPHQHTRSHNHTRILEKGKQTQTVKSNKKPSLSGAGTSQFLVAALQSAVYQVREVRCVVLVVDQLCDVRARLGCDHLQGQDAERLFDLIAHFVDACMAQVRSTRSMHGPDGQQPKASQCPSDTTGPGRSRTAAFQRGQLWLAA